MMSRYLLSRVLPLRQVCRQPLLRRVHSLSQPTYHHSQLDNTENLEDYRPGGFHPTSIGDVFANGRYRVLHKLGWGGSSTVWLARDQQEKSNSGPLVALKVLSASGSSASAPEAASLHVSRELQAALASTAHPARSYIQNIDDDFLEVGPNGTHACLVSRFEGPSVLLMSDSPGRVSGSRRLRQDLARNVAMQSALALEAMHSVGFVHGDVSSSNILFKAADRLRNSSDTDLYGFLGVPESESVLTREGSPPGPSAPSAIVAPVDIRNLSHSLLLQENVVLIDFGQSYAIGRKPVDYRPAGPRHYLAPESYFDRQMSPAADVWAFGCVLFEIRAGSPLFDPFFDSSDMILRQIVQTLGRLPEPWWAAWDSPARRKWFEESSTPRSLDAQERAGPGIRAVATPLRQKLQEVGASDDPPLDDEGSLIEKTGTPLQLQEVELLADLLEKMLRYRPEDRITMQEVVRHPWFSYDSPTPAMLSTSK